MTPGPHPDQLVALAIGRAYRAFEGHRLGRSMTVRRPDVTAADVQALARPLRQLEPPPLDKWLPHAATTWGTVADLKALLPRVLELFAVGRLQSTPEVLFGKLAQLDVGSWPGHERAAIDDVVSAIWLASLARHPARIGYPAWRLLASLAELGSPLSPYLEDWQLLLAVPGPTGDAARRHHDDLVHQADRVLARNGDLTGLFWSPQPEEARRLEAWLARS